jgi:hypothetical protein
VVAVVATTFLKKVRRMLGLSLHAWESVMLAFLAVAAIAAAVVGLSTYAVVQLQKQEAADAKKDFNTYKITVEAQVEDAKKEGLEAGKTAANALVRAAELEAANLALEAQIAPRRLSAAQQQSMLFDLTPYAGRVVAVQSYSLDAEGTVLASQLMRVLTGSGLQAVDRLASVSPMGGFILGIHISGTDEQLVGALRSTLSNTAGLAVASDGQTMPAIGIGGMSIVDEGQPLAGAQVSIGVKPLADQ